MKCKLSFLRNVTNAPVYVCIIGLKVGSSIGLLNTRKVLSLGKICYVPSELEV